MRTQFGRLALRVLATFLMWTGVLFTVDAQAFEIEAGRVSLHNTFSTPTFTQVTFSEPFDKVPVVVIRTSHQGGDRTVIRIRNVTRTGFEAVQAETTNHDGPHAVMTADYIAMEPGTHVLPGGVRVVAGFHETMTFQQDLPLSLLTGWDNITFPQALASGAAVVAAIQTMNNEFLVQNLTGAHVLSVPQDPSVPFMTVAINRLPTTTGFQVALERSEANVGLILVPERIGYIAFPSGQTGALTSNTGATINWAAVRSPEVIRGWANGCFAVNHGLNSGTVRSVATKNTRDEADGGWLRSCSLNSTQIGLRVDEVDNRSHPDAEIAGILSFSNSFHAGDDFGDAPDTGPGTGPGNYATSVGKNGPRHAGGLSSPVWLGIAPGDTDDGTRQNSTGTADDAESGKSDDPQNSVDDEDAVVFPASFEAGQSYRLLIGVQGTGFVSAWIDWNGDGDFTDAGETVADNRSASNEQILVASTAPSAVTTSGITFMRVRVCSTSGQCNTPTGRANDGEVEDYRIAVNAAFVLQGRVFVDNGAGGATAHDGVAAGSENGLGGVQLAVVDVLSSTTYDTVVTDGDGTYEAVLPAGADGRAVTIAYTVPTGARAMSETGASLTGLVNVSQNDAEQQFTPVLGNSYTDINFGLIRLPSLTQAQSVAIAPGLVSVLQHVYRATTTSNVTFALANTSINQPGAFATALFRDSNCNGTLEAGEAAVVAPIPVLEGEVICLLVRIQASSGAADGARIQLDIVARSEFSVTSGGTATSDSFEMSNTDVAVVSQVSATLRKTVRNVTQGGTAGTSNTGAAGDTLEYVLTLTNPSTLAMANVEILDKTPAYTTLAQPIVAPSVTGGTLSCSVVSPAGAANSVGYDGVVQWSCVGTLIPAGQVVATYRVRIDP